jgi:hypothetical protein
VEAHIEQGPVLERMGKGICTVTGTKGIERERLVFRGQAAHAGTMPMEMRRVQFPRPHRASPPPSPRSAQRHGGVTTVGHAQCSPGVVTAVAGETLITMDMRHIDADALATMFREAHEAATAAAAAEGCSVEWEHIFRIPPMPFHPLLLDAARTAVADVEGHDVELPSGALHDASEMAREVPTVMIFSSSTNGLSHTKEEDTPESHLLMAVDALRSHVPPRADGTDRLRRALTACPSPARQGRWATRIADWVNGRSRRGTRRPPPSGAPSAYQPRIPLPDPRHQAVMGDGIDLEAGRAEEVPQLARRQCAQPGSLHPSQHLGEAERRPGLGVGVHHQGSPGRSISNIAAAPAPAQVVLGVQEEAEGRHHVELAVEHARADVDCDEVGVWTVAPGHLQHARARCRDRRPSGTAAR